VEGGFFCPEGKAGGVIYDYFATNYNAVKSWTSKVTVHSSCNSHHSVLIVEAPIL
jgi:hypothetical protein